MMLENLKKEWDRYTEGWFGTIVYLFLGFAIAYSFNFLLGYALNTETPVVAVESCSMEHSTINNWWYQCGPLRPDEVCGTSAAGYDVTNFDDYWKLCGGWYESRNMTKQEFESFPFGNGLDVGDMILVMNTEDVRTGDIIVFNQPLRQVPIIHRVYSVNGSAVLTKGDNNLSPDPSATGKIYGKAVFRIPLLGWVKILFDELVRDIAGLVHR